jgi:RNA polymerase sigma factor (sigma-70 family)
LIENEESIQVYKALAKLPDEQHEAVVLHLYGEMKFKEIADLLHISINTAQSRYRYGIDKLKTLL